MADPNNSNPAVLQLDLRGLQCPLPVLKTAKRMAAMHSGDRVEILASDPMAATDFMHFCNEKGHVLNERLDMGDHERFVITKG